MSLHIDFQGVSQEEHLTNNHSHLIANRRDGGMYLLSTHRLRGGSQEEHICKMYFVAKTSKDATSLVFLLRIRIAA